MSRADTIPKILRQQYEKYGSKKVAMRKKDYGIWNEYTWKDQYEHVRDMSLGLASLGLNREDKVCILGDNDPEWYWAQLAAQCAGGIGIGVFIDCSPEEVKYYIEHSDTKFVFARDQEQVDKVLSIQDELPNLIKIIYWDERGLWFYNEPKLINIKDLEEAGRKYGRENPDAFDKNIDMTTPSDVALIAYTSGTTGLPKGAMLTYKVLDVNYEQILKVENFDKNDDYLSYISPAWVTEQIFGVYAGIAVPIIINFPEKPETVQEDVRNVGPHILFYGARLWEDLASSIQVKIIDSTPLKRFCYNTALKIGYKKVNAVEKNMQPGLLTRLLVFLSDFFVMRSLRDRVGLSRTKACFTAGAAISPDIMKLFHAIGVNLKNLYGSTEGGLVTWHRDGDIKPETVGPQMPDVKIRISDEGEIQVKSEAVFKGYYKNPEASAEKIKDGFYCTDDAGYIDENGHLVYYDRLKDMVDLANGTRFSPQYIESRLRFSVYIRDAIVIGGEETPFIISLINMDFDNMAKWAEAKRIVFTTFADLSQKEETREVIKNEIMKVNQFLPEEARIKKFVVLHKEFDPDEAEMTRTRKLKRSPIEDKYGDLIKCMYGDDDNFTVESEVKYRDGRVGKMSMKLGINSIS